MPRRRAPEPSKIEEPNMTPMIDVIFQLLIFFLVGCKFKAIDGTLKQYLPKTKGPETYYVHPEDQPLVIHVRAGTVPNEAIVSFEKNPIGRVQLQTTGREVPGNRAIWARLRGVILGVYEGHAHRPIGERPPLQIAPHPEAPFQLVVTALDTAKSCNVAKVEFQASPDHEPGVNNK